MESLELLQTVFGAAWREHRARQRAAADVEQWRAGRRQQQDEGTL